MTILNEKTAKTEKVIHLLVTSLCDRNCKYCCNKQYDLNDVPYVTEEELNKAEVICLTGGEPFKYSRPCEIADKLKSKYPNIKYVYVYTNAREFCNYLVTSGYYLYNINGVNIGVKNKRDLESLPIIINIFKDYRTQNCKSNRIYNQTNEPINIETNIPIIERKWEKEFIPADDSIFRKI